MEPSLDAVIICSEFGAKHKQVTALWIKEKSISFLLRLHPCKWNSLKKKGGCCIGFISWYLVTLELHGFINFFHWTILWVNYLPHLKNQINITVTEEEINEQNGNSIWSTTFIWFALQKTLQQRWQESQEDIFKGE